MGWMQKKDGASLIDNEENLVGICIADNDVDEESVSPPIRMTKGRNWWIRSPIKPRVCEQQRLFSMKASETRIVEAKAEKKNKKKVINIY